MKNDNDGADYVSDEIKRKHEHTSARWDSLDAKIGIILGFTIIVIFQVILSSDINEFVGVQAGSTAHTALAYLAFDLFLSGFVCFITATFVGLKAFWVQKFRETDPVGWGWIKEYVDQDIDGHTFNGKVTKELCKGLVENERRVQEKAAWLRTMLMIFFCGVMFFVARFAVELISVRFT
jgi:hypothetical protein